MICVSLKNDLQNLNIFEESTENNEPVDAQLQRSNIIATRVYFIAIILILFFLGIYLSLIIQFVLVTVEYPSEEQFHTLPQDANCLCSRISLQYGKFTSLEPILHQICSSDFISDRWIHALFTGANATYFSLNDFRGFASAQFEALSAFCRLSDANIQQSIASFNQSTFISSQLLSEDALRLQILSASDQFQKTAPKNFNAQLELLRRVIASNKIISGLQTNYIFSYFFTMPAVSSSQYWKADEAHCDCLVDISCASDAVFDTIFSATGRYTTGQRTVVPGIAAGCLPMSSILASTLQCFYNQTCVDFIISYFPTTETFVAMSPLVETHFNPETTVQSILDALMIEDWNVEISYHKYYKECAPISCSYSEEQYKDLLFVITKLIGLLSAVTLALGLVVPMIVKFIMKKLSHEKSPNVPISLRVRFQQLKMMIMKIAIELNVFKHYQSTDRQIQYQRYATRLYLFLTMVAVGLLVQYNLINSTLHRDTVLNPSESVYNELEQTYSSGVSCPCSLISIPYSKFITIQPVHHQVCSSYLISPTWIEYTYSGLADAYYIYDYRFTASTQFRTLAMLCQQAQQTVNDSLGIFLQTQLVSSQVISQQSFESEIYGRINDWKSSIVSQFNRTIQLISASTLTNQLMNRLNIYFHTYENETRMTIEPRLYDECNCAYSDKCHINLSIYWTDNTANDPDKSLRVPNFYVGCFLLEALLLSTLECFYDESCMLGLDQFLNPLLRQSLTFPALNATLNSPNQTIQSITDQLMVDSWLENVSYGAYYAECDPKSCKVEYYGLNTFFIVVTIVLGICGGLLFGLKMLILIVLRLIEKVTDTNFSFTISRQSIKRFLKHGDEKTMINRLHLILVIITLGILYSSFTFTPKIVVVETKTPSFQVYESLARKHGDSLRCSCSEISIEYRSFLNITSTFHPVCFKNFAKARYLAFLLTNPDFYRTVPVNYGYAGIGQLNALDSFCAICKDVVQNSLSQLLSSHLINTELLSSNSLSQRIQTTINDQRFIMLKLFLNTFSLIREMIIANKFMTTFSTNWIFSLPADVRDGNLAHTIPVEYNGCNCALSSKCMMELFGVKIGCYTVEALFQSTFECLYNQGCLDATNTVQALDVHLNPSRFAVNSTIESVINELMIENLTHDVSYAQYFAQCAPSSCVYSYTGSSDLVEGLTILISLYGGLVIICRLIAVILAKLLPYRLTRVEPMQSEWNN